MKTQPSNTTEAYARGYAAGRADALLGFSSVMARTAPTRECALGYVDGNDRRVVAEYGAGHDESRLGATSGLTIYDENDEDEWVTFR